MRLNAQQLRQLKQPEKLVKIKRIPIYFILENIYDTYNVGGLFRLADALAIEKIYFCGETETPPNAKIMKASIGTYKIVPWEYKKTAIGVIKLLRGLSLDKDRPHIIAVEQHQKAILYTKASYQLPLALIFGNETYGILPETLILADQIVEIPMFGINKSLNVIVSAAIVGYYIRPE
jgi:tRNA G18 (ribose-2'-O)-methylase SpoU